MDMAMQKELQVLTSFDSVVVVFPNPLFFAVIIKIPDFFLSEKG